MAFIGRLRSVDLTNGGAGGTGNLTHDDGRQVSAVA